MAEDGTKFENAVVCTIPVASKKVWLKVMTMFKTGVEPKKYIKINECWQSEQDQQWRDSPKIKQSEQYGAKATMNINFPVNTPEEIAHFETVVNGMNQLLVDFKATIDPFDK